MTARLLVERSPSCGLRVSDPHASGEHATVTWTGWHWEIKDLGSRNGTYVDGTKLDPGVAVKLTAGSRIAFGDPERDWEMATDDPPNLIPGTDAFPTSATMGSSLVNGVLGR